MPEIIFTGPGGRVEGRYHPARQKNAPIGSGCSRIQSPAAHEPSDRRTSCITPSCTGFSVLRFNFRGVGAARGVRCRRRRTLGRGVRARWAQTINPKAACWVAGFSFGAWIGMQLLMRRPEIEGFIRSRRRPISTTSLPRPLPVLGPHHPRRQGCGRAARDVTTLVEKLRTQKGIVIDQKVIPGANHFFDGKLEPLMTSVAAYLDMRLAKTRLRRTSAA